jgi:hypothetical protein
MPCVYILSNPTIPGLLKIGYTSRTAEERCNELSGHSGVATPYRVVWFIRTTSIESAQDLEQRVHLALDQCRYNRAREFFECTEALAKDTVEKIAHTVGAAALPDLALVQQLREAEAARVAQAEAEQERANLIVTAAKQRLADEAATALRRATAEENRLKRAEHEKNMRNFELLFSLAVLALVFGWWPSAMFLGFLAWIIHPKN